jgi:Raf kinase inhibitor-like YbhB/YbcL family protein
MSMKLTSPAFESGDSIPVKYTCEGEDVSPPLAWSDVPDGTRSLALVCEDPDAPSGTWIHWVIYDIPPSFTQLSEGVPTTEVTPTGAKQGMNDFKRAGYGGPCPPPGKAHRYYFRIYALDIAPGLPAGATRADLQRAIEGHVLDRGELLSLFERG